MRERSELMLKIACGVLAALLLFQLGRMVLRVNPLRGVRIPDVPTLMVNSNQPVAKATNSVAGPVARTNATNTAASIQPGKAATNASPAQASAKVETNSPAKPADPVATNLVASQALTNAGTNVVANQTTNKLATNAVAAQGGTNASAARVAGKAAQPSFMGPAGTPKLPEIPPIVQARMDRITQSELLAPFIRPLPMALLGIAGRDAFLRAPSGQTGLVKEGDELGGIKLLKIGINRVLVEQAGEQKELMIFSGMGGESLLPKPNVATNETNSKIK